MTLKDIAKKLTTSIQTIPELVRILAEGLENAEAGSQIEVTAIQESGTKIATITIDEEATNIYAPEVDTSHNYSTTERKTGKWIDGTTDVYEKVLDLGSEVTISYNAWTDTNISAGDIKVILTAFTPSYGNLMMGINADTEFIIQTPRNGDTVTARYIIMTYTKAAL